MIRTEVLHAMVVHLPIALLLAAYVFYAASAPSKSEQLAAAGKWALIAGALGAIAAAVTGFIAAGSTGHTEAAHKILESTHEPLGTVVMASAVGLAFWGFLAKWDFKGPAFAVFMFVFTSLAAAVCVTGYSGTKIVYQSCVAAPAKDGAPHQHHDSAAGSASDTHQDHTGHEGHIH